ncbi:hypothetical protein J3459_004036 [Metarhizium acridum]|uniref:Yeast cell wall synthesis Kre9/Knh1-like N-terminal domain-containing protein n=1 Tax=Metarhizium acridum (strain CQMa 102) TaxID=655827 RepID=E9DZZ2_METAQ|nr:uncharacterized protein MAC_03190 [Metarhizium acridum CQMa 102]EFY90827.1 hypothetical protein MAC_03190 [Metarhizium acridum CQMa 102]KAG8421065.1 hypothetical protein J3458_002972 [Metarhizium acridum]KAG8428331.1 hypothetical protein J3459_004036 [Metarhizium acridum]
MRFSVAAVLAFAATAFAQAADFDPIYTPKSGETIVAGSPYTITWDAPAKYLDGTVKIELIGGATQNTQVKLADIASGVKNSAKTYTWTVGASLGDKAVYGLVFRLESQPDTIFQYSNPFHIKASGSQPSGSSSGSITITTSYGTKTVTLSTTSTPVTSTAAASTSVATTSAPATTSTQSKTTKYNTTLPANTTTTLVFKTSSSQSAPVVISSTAVFKPTTTAPSTIATPTAAANAVRVGSLTILGVVAAVLAL